MVVVKDIRVAVAVALVALVATVYTMETRVLVVSV